MAVTLTSEALSMSSAAQCSAGFAQNAEAEKKSNETVRTVCSTTVEQDKVNISNKDC